MLGVALELEVGFERRERVGANSVVTKTDKKQLARQRGLHTVDLFLKI